MFVHPGLEGLFKSVAKDVKKRALASRNNGDKPIGERNDSLIWLKSSMFKLKNSKWNAILIYDIF